MNIFPNTEKIYAEFTLFGGNIIKISLLRNIDEKDCFIDIGIVYPEITLKADSEKELIQNKNNFEEYLKLLSFKEIETPDVKEFLSNPKMFGNYILLVKEEKKVTDYLKLFFPENLKTSLYVYDKPLWVIESFTRFLNNSLKNNMRIIDTVNVVSGIQYEKYTNVKQKLLILQKHSSGKI